jgi:hypothetical protein
MKLFNEESLRNVVALEEWKTGNRLPDIAACHVAANHILNNILGPEWIQQHILNVESNDNFSYTKPQANIIQDIRSQLDILMLAEMIYHFQEVPGFDEKINYFKKKDDVKGVKGALAELEVARMLFMSGIAFRFVKTIKKKGFDYDLEAILGSTIVPCEAKCKMPTTNLTTKSFKHSFDKGCKQLQKDRPNIVFAKIPEEWISNPSFAYIENRVRMALNRIGRISTVILFFIKWIETDNVLAGKFLTIHNKNARQSLANFGKIITLPFGVGIWISLASMIGRTTPKYHPIPPPGSLGYPRPLDSNGPAL